MAQSTAKARSGFTFYRSFSDAIRLLGPRDQLALFHAIADYALDERQPDLGKLSKTARICWVTIQPNLDANLARFHNGCKPKSTRSEANAKQTASKPQADSITNDDNVNDDVNDDENENVSERARAHDSNSFTPPSVEEVRDYIALKGLEASAEAFVDYYTSNGWRVGRTPMRDWQAALRNWARRDTTAAFSLSLKIADNEPQPVYQAL